MGNNALKDTDITGDLAVSGDSTFGASSTSRIDLASNLVEDPIPLATTGWTAAGTIAMSSDIPPWAPGGTQSISVTDPGDGGNPWVNGLQRILAAGSFIDLDEYTISYWCKGSVSGLVLNMDGFAMSSSPSTAFGRTNTPITTTWTFYRRTLTYTAGGYSGAFGAPRFEFGANTTAGTFFFYNIKLERGNVATPFAVFGKLAAGTDGKIGSYDDRGLIDVVAGQVTIDGALESKGLINTPETITTDTTPTAVGRCVIVIGAWTAANNITDFDNGVEGQYLEIHGGDTDCNIVDGSGIELVGGTTWNAAVGATIAFRLISGTWRELFRSVT